MLTLFESALSDFCDTAWNEHFVNITILEPLVSDLCDAVWKLYVSKNAELPKTLVAYRKILWWKHRSGLWDVLLNIPSVFFSGPHFL